MWSISSRKDLDKDARKLLTGNMMFRSAILISKIFLNIYVFDLTQNLTVVAIYNIIAILFFVIAYIFIAHIQNIQFRVKIQEYSIYITAITYLLLSILGGNILNFIYFFAMIFGVSTGLYWLVYNNSEYDLTNFHNRGHYQGLKKFLKTIISIALPPFIGVLIVMNPWGLGYQISFFIGCIFFALSASLIKIPKKITKQKLDFKEFYKAAIENKRISIMIVIIFLLGIGLSNSLLAIIMPLIIFADGSNEMSVGFIVSVLSFIALFSAYIFGKFVDYKYYSFSVVLAAIFHFVTVLAFILFPGLINIAIISAIFTLLFVFIDIPKSVLCYNILESKKKYSRLKSEYIVYAGIAYALGEMLTFICILFIGNISHEGLKILFLILSFFVLISACLFCKISKGEILAKNI